jgi:hypothetical protein
MAREAEQQEPSWWRVGKYIGFALVVAAFAMGGERVGGRAVGLFIVLQAYILLQTKRLPYGWEGQDPSGHITGPVVQVLAVLWGGLGAAFIARPTFMLGLLGFVD